MAIVTYTFNCESCDEEHTKKRSDKFPAPRFCSNPCRFKGQEKDELYTRVQCDHCGEGFDKYLPPSIMNEAGIYYCSKSCAGKAVKLRQGHALLETEEFDCRWCGTHNVRKQRARHVPFKYCSTSCSSKHLVQQGKGCFVSFKQMHEQGRHELVDYLTNVRSEATIRRNTGRPQSEETKAKIATSCTGIPNVLKGKTFEEFYGAERAKELCEQHSRALLEGFASGRLTPQTSSEAHGRYVNGTYRGVTFRSSYEYAFMKLQEEEGLIVGVDIVYEPQELRVPYEFEGSTHTYFPDFFDLEKNVVYEVKPKSVLLEPKVVAKCSAAYEFFGSIDISFQLITEDDLKNIPTRDQVYADPLVTRADT